MPLANKILAAALLTGFVAAPGLAWAETKAKPDTATAAAGKSGASASDDFEENRRAHMRKSKENNEKKGAE